MDFSLKGTLFLVLAIGACDSSVDDDGTSNGDGASESGGEPSPLTVNEGGNTVLVSDDWKACVTASDCVRVATSCDFCCGEEAIHEDLADAYGEQVGPLCEPYEGGVCDCAPDPTQVDCVEQLCTMVPA